MWNFLIRKFLEAMLLSIHNISHFHHMYLLYSMITVVEFKASVTLLLEMQQKEITSDKPIYPLHIMEISLTFKTIE